MLNDFRFPIRMVLGGLQGPAFLLFFSSLFESTQIMDFWLVPFLTLGFFVAWGLRSFNFNEHEFVVLPVVSVILGGLLGFASYIFIRLGTPLNLGLPAISAAIAFLQVFGFFMVLFFTLSIVFEEETLEKLAS